MTTIVSLKRRSTYRVGNAWLIPTEPGSVENTALHTLSQMKYTPESKQVYFFGFSTATRLNYWLAGKQVLRRYHALRRHLLNEEHERGLRKARAEYGCFTANQYGEDHIHHVRVQRDDRAYSVIGSGTARDTYAEAWQRARIAGNGWFAESVSFSREPDVAAQVYWWDKVAIKTVLTCTEDFTKPYNVGRYYIAQRVLVSSHDDELVALARDVLADHDLEASRQFRGIPQPHRDIYFCADCDALLMDGAVCECAVNYGGPHAGTA